MRVGNGFDVHKFQENRALILGGVKIPHPVGLLGHSDADVLVHAVIDAILGAAAMGDIGTHFPDTDEKYKGISSIELLDKTKELINTEGYFIVNIDATIIAQVPKLAPYILEMRKNLSDSLKIDIENINIKATTTEGLGFCGRKEGIAASAVCLIDKTDNMPAF